ncbi:MAG: cation transporter [Planctomycetaceae bacterium]|nr:cation transporter [Planctomycetaceae bacterium]
MSHCSHHYDHAHDHSHANRRRLTWTMGLVSLYFLAELIGGWWTNSLSLLADAGHMFSDLAALGLSLWVARLRLQPSGGQRTFGYHRAEILGALVNGALLLLVAGGILRESWERLQHSQDVLGPQMFGIAIGGLIVNLLSLSILHGGHQHDLNMRGAWLHVLGDTLGSVAVIVAAILVWCCGWTWADPVASLLVCLIIIFSSWNLVQESLSILMEHAPADVPVPEVAAAIKELPGVRDIHCLHIWTIATGLRSLSAHIVLEPDQPAEPLLEDLHRLLAERFGTQHLTLQIETEGFSGCEAGSCAMGRHPQPESVP